LWSSQQKEFLLGSLFYPLSKKELKMSAATDAKRMFVENLNSFGNEQTQPEKYNLYLALIYLTASVEQIQQDLEQIKQMLDVVNK
jgi:hypothetical protein